MKQIILYILLTAKLFGLDFEFLTKIPIPSNIIINDYNLKDATVNVNQNGEFMWKCPHYSGMFSIFVRTNYQYFYLQPYGQYSINNTTNYISSSVENDKLYIIQDELQITTSKTYDADFTLKTLTPKNTYLLETENTSRKLTRIKLSPNSRAVLERSSDSVSKKQIIKYNESNVSIATNQMNSNLHLSFNPYPSYSSKTILAFEIKDRFVYFYKFTDSDLLPSPNRITLGASQNGSLTATVNNPEQALLNIQSSTNLIDWNTFKTIKNEPSLEVVIPANKKQEFIRAIE